MGEGHHTKSCGARLSQAACSVWGKTDREDGEEWLPLYVHMSDSARVAARIWDDWLPGGTREIIACDVEGHEDVARKIVMFLAGVHDLGKATPVFQDKPIRYGDGASMSWIAQEAGLAIPTITDHASPTHPEAGAFLLDRYLVTRHHWKPRVSEGYASIVGSHHGKPLTHRALQDARCSGITRRHIGADDAAWSDVQRELIAYVADIAGIDDTLFSWLGCHPLSAQSQVLITAIVIMADWIASNSDDDMFPLVPVLHSAGSVQTDIVTEEGLQRRAERGWRHVHLPPAWKSDGSTLRDAADVNAFYAARFHLPEDAHPRPVQQDIVRLCAETGNPGLFIVEAPMGEGKTEAALSAAEILGVRTGRGGVCVALPTMATTDAMFGRVRAWLDALPQEQGNNEKNIWLSHGKAQLNDEFSGIIRASNMRLSSIDDGDGGSGFEERVAAETVVSEWLRGRKKGVLANFLVCTVDQVLMGALRVKHVMLRQLALANKVVVIDECHAYDSYMREYLKRVLEWLGGFRTPVVMLSATLPRAIRDSFVAAYMQGRYGSAHVAVAGADSTKEDVVDEPYPMITYTDVGTVHHKNVRPSARRIDMEFVVTDDDDESVVALLDRLLADGGCAGVVCDTVDRAQALAQCARARFGSDDVILTHSRFVDEDRMGNEEHLRRLLGPRATTANGQRPQRLIVVGTQVLEQSLDIDFDVMVSDVAPIDLLIQRVGRVHRHLRGDDQSDRPEQLRQAVCYVRGIEEWAPNGPSFARNVDRVYEGASLMDALAVLGLTRAGTSCVAHLPKDIAHTVRTAYEADLIRGLIPVRWIDAYDELDVKRARKEAEQRERAQTYLMRSLSAMRGRRGSLIDFFDLKIDDTGSAGDDAGNRAVRDTQDTIEVMLVCRHGDAIQLLPWIGDDTHGVSCGASIPIESTPDTALAKMISRSSVRLPAKMCQRWDADALIDTLEEQCGNIVAQWQESPWLAGRLALVLTQDEASGEAATAETTYSACIDRWNVSYSRREGLSVISRDKDEESR